MMSWCVSVLFVFMRRGKKWWFCNCVYVCNFFSPFLLLEFGHWWSEGDDRGSYHVKAIEGEYAVIFGCFYIY